MSPDLFATVPGVPSTTGVALNAPPVSILAQATKMVSEAVATIPPGSKGALVAIATEKGVNLALASKVGDHVEVTTWIGKSWGAPIAGGAAVKVTF